MAVTAVLSRPFRALRASRREPKPKPLAWAWMDRPFGAVLAGADLRSAFSFLPRSHRVA
jgi:hypothetical protein